MSKKRIRAHYEHRITPERENYDVLDWASSESQEARFQVLVDNVDLAGKSLLDVGCGLGDLWEFLHQRGIEVDYTGVDILEKMIQAARTQHGDAHFVQGDVFAGDPFEGRQFDVVFCSGTFNLNLGNNRQFVPAAARRLLELAREHMVFNLLHTRARYRDHTYVYHNPEDVREMLRALPCEMCILDDYLHNDFTVICRPR